MIHRINQLAEGVGGFTPHDEQLEALHQAGLAAVSTGQRRVLHGVIDHEGGLNQIRLHPLLKGLHQQTAHGIRQSGHLKALCPHGSSRLGA